MREGMRDIQDIVVTLVSVAIGEPYETSLRRMGATASAAGFNKTLLWKAEDFLSRNIHFRLREGNSTSAAV